MTLPVWIGIPGVVLLIAVIAYGFRQGMKVTSEPEGTPPDNTGGGGPST